MNTLPLIAMVIAALAVTAAVFNFALSARREARREAVEQAIARAGHEYLAKHGISCRTIGVVLADGSTTLLIEAAPHKKLRFSFVIEPSIAAYVKKMTGHEARRIFWRFPIKGGANKPATAPEQGAPGRAEPTAAAVVADKATPPASAQAEPESGDGLDDYLYQHHSYHIEEVSWNDFNTTVAGEEGAGTAPEAAISEQH